MIPKIEGRADCTRCHGNGFILVDEWIGPLQGRKECECIHLMDCPTCGAVLDMRDFAQVMCHGLPVPDQLDQFACLTEEDIERHRNGVLSGPKTGRRVRPYEQN